MMWYPFSPAQRLQNIGNQQGDDSYVRKIEIAPGGISFGPHLYCPGNEG
jgi:hypothetical protein